MNANETLSNSPTSDTTTLLRDPSAISQQLRSLYRAGVASSLSASAQTFTKDDCQRYEEYFRFARFAIRYTLHTDLLTESAEKCRFLFDAGKYVKEVGDFLAAALLIRPMTRSEMLLVDRAFESLLLGLRSPSPQIIEQCLSVFDFVLEKLSTRQRADLRVGLKPLKQKGLTDNLTTLLESTSIYLEQLTSIDDALKSSDESIESGRVISIHSTKGGVGKSTVAAALAIHLARNPENNVCLIDADDEGPALEFYFPTARRERKKALRFVNWFASPSAHQWFPQELLQPLSKGDRSWRDRLTLVAGSIISADIQKLDEVQGPQHSELNQRKICAFAKHLILQKKFSHVIFDSAPGMAHLALDIFLSTLRLNGCTAIVLRPRAPDIVALATEEAWLTEARLKDRLAVVADFSEADTTAMLKDTDVLYAALEKTPIIAAFMDRYPEMTPDRVSDFFKQNWHKLKSRVRSLPHLEPLVHAADIVPDATSSKTIAEVIAEDTKCAKMAEELTQVIQIFSTPKSL